MKKVLTGLALALVGLSPAQAQELNHLQAVHTAGSGDHVQLVFETNRPPQYHIYSRQNPDRLVVELIDTDLEPSVRPGTVPHGAVDWKVKQTDLSHTQACLGLRFRLPMSQIKTSQAGNQLRVDVDLSYDNEDSFALTPAIKWLRREVTDGASYVLYNELSFDPSDPKLHIDVGLAQDRLDAREKPTSMVTRHSAVAGVNGGYFATSGGPLGVVVRDGKLLAPHVDRRPPRTVMGVMKNRKIEFDQMIAKGGTLTSRGGASWNDVELALGGGPRLLHRNQLALTTDAEELGPRGNDITRSTARTAVATTRDGRMLVVTATGYHDNHLQGMRLEELATMLQRRGGSEAMNLDGGASTTMALGNQVVSNGPAAGTAEKAVATTLLVSDERAPTYPSSLRLELPSRLPADGSTHADLAISVTDPSGRPVADGTPVRLFAEQLRLGEGLVKTHGGKATIAVCALRHPGLAHVRAECGAAHAEASLKLEAGKPNRVLFRCTEPLILRADAPVDPAASPSPSASPAYQRPVAQQLALTIQVNDNWGNALAGVPVQVLGEGGETLQAGLTSASGQTTAGLQLPLTGAHLQLQVAGLPNVPVVVVPWKEAP